MFVLIKKNADGHSMDTLQKYGSSTSPRNFFKGSPAMAPAFKKSSASWWLNQPIWKICSSNWIISPRFGMKIKKSLKFHHLGCFLVQNPSCPWDGKALMRRGKRSLQIAIMCFCTQYVCSQFYRLFQFFFTFVLRILFVSQYLLPNICSSHSFLPNIFFPFFLPNIFFPIFQYVPNTYTIMYTQYVCSQVQLPRNNDDLAKLLQTPPHQWHRRGSPRASRLLTGTWGMTTEVHQKYGNYTLVNKHSNGKSPCSIGHISSNGPFSIAMLVNRSVTKYFTCMNTISIHKCFQPFMDE